MVALRKANSSFASTRNCSSSSQAAHYDWSKCETFLSSSQVPEREAGVARSESQLVIPVLETGSESAAQQQPQPQPQQQQQQFKTEKRFMVELETKGEEQEELLQLILKQQQRQHRSGGGGVVGPSSRLDPVYGQWRWDDSRLVPFGNAGDVPRMGYVPVQPPPGALPPRPPPPAGSGPPRRGTRIAPRLCFKCQQPGHICRSMHCARARTCRAKSPT